MLFFLFSIVSLFALKAWSIPHADKLLLLTRTHSYHDSMIIGRSIRSNLLTSNPLERNIFNPLKDHDATKDDQYALSQWLRMPVSNEKLNHLKRLLQNPTVDFKIQETLKLEFYSLMKQDQRNRHVDPRRLGHISSVLDQAAELGDYEVVKGLQDKGLKVRESTLHAAAKSGNLLLVRYLIEIAKIRVDELTLISAIIGGNLEVTKYLVYIQKCKINLVTLYAASELGNWKIVKFLLETSGIIKDVVSLHLFVLKPAARAGKVDTIRVMLRRDGKVLYNPDYIFMPELIDEGCRSGSFEMVDFLIKKTGLEPDIKCLENAIKSGDMKLVSSLIKTYKLMPTQEMFDETVHVFNHDLMNFLLKNYFFKASYTFVLKAAELGDVNYLKFLINGFNLIPDIKALLNACINGQFEMVKFLTQEIHLVPNMECLNHVACSGNVALFDYLLSSSDLQPNSLTLRYACLGADEDLEHDHSKMINYIKGLCAAIHAEWDIMNTGIPQTMEMDANRVWIVSESTFNCLNKNNEFIWRIFHGEAITQSQIVPGKGIVYLSNHSKLGLRSLENGDLKWEISFKYVSKFTCRDYIQLDDGSILDFNGQKVSDEYENIVEKDKPIIKVDQNTLSVGSLEVKYKVSESGYPTMYAILEDIGELLVFTDSGLLIFYKDDNVLWTRDVSLSKVHDSKFIKGELGYIWVAMTKFGSIVALDAATGVKLWRLYFEKKQYKFMQVSVIDGKSFLNVCSLKECIKVDVDTGNFEYILENADLKIVSTLPIQNDRYLALVDTDFMVELLPNSESVVDNLGNASLYFYTGLEVGSNTISGYLVQNQKEISNRKFSSEKMWTIDLPDSQVIVAVSKNQAEDPVASLGRVLGDRSVLYKYLNPNLVAFVAESPSKTSLSKSLTFYLIDTVSGAIHYRAFHPGAGQITGKKSSIQVLLTENLAIYTYWNYGPDSGNELLNSAYANETIPNNKGMEIVVLEIYESGKPDKRISGSRFSSFSSDIPAIISSAFMFPFPITSIGQTRTVSGITSKQILFGLESGQVYGVGRKVLDARRPEILSSNDKEEELLQYSPIIDFNPINSVTGKRFISNEWVKSCPMQLESSSLVISGGIDIVCRVVHPSSNFDVLSDDFGYFSLIGTIIVLAVLTVGAKFGVERKQLKHGWH